VRENIADLRRKINELDSKRKELEAKIAAESGRRDEIKLCSDRVAARIAKAEAAERLLRTESVVAFQGWIPASAEHKLAEVLSSFECAWETQDPTEDEIPDVPIMLKNNSLARPLEMVTEMYSLPTYDGIDPSPLMMPFFVLFFGIMYADLGYGLLVMALSALILTKAKPRGGTRKLMELAFMCGISSAVIGWVTGGFFGDLIASVAKLFGREAPVLPPVFNYLTHPLINPMESMIDVLVYSLVLGGIQIIVGMAIKAYMLIRDGHFLDALFDVGSWWLLFAGIALGALGKGWYVCYAGVAALILTQGRAKKGIFAKLFGGIASLYNITSYLGDVLSYSRLMALMLAGSVIATIVNMLGTMTGSIIGFALIFIFGTYVHTCRLQYLEFFGKFYSDGGRAFAPLQINAKYVDIVKEE
jgi:V/A-type H+-transporting ATPase subunit I